MRFTKAPCLRGFAVFLSADFLSSNGLRGASTVRAALKDLAGKDIAYKSDFGWIVYDRLFAEYLRTLQ